MVRAQVYLDFPGVYAYSPEFACLGSRFFTADSKDAPSIAIRMFSDDARRQLVFRVCKDGRKHNHYYARTPPVRSGDLCRTSEQEGSLDLFGWSKIGKPVDQTMLADGDGCPLASDIRYIPTGVGSDEALVRFHRLWRQMTSSPTAFDAAFEQFGWKSSKGVWSNVWAKYETNLSHYFVDLHAPLASVSCFPDGKCRAAQFYQFSMEFGMKDGQLVLTAIDASTP